MLTDQIVKNQFDDKPVAQLAGSAADAKVKGNHVLRSGLLKRARTNEESPDVVASQAADDEDDESEQEHLRQQSVKMTTVRPDDAKGVEEFLLNRLRRLQQLALKKISKAWIKGICPKKQANFPYTNRGRRLETGQDAETPEWWPTDVCHFKEPDHINRHGVYDDQIQ